MVAGRGHGGVAHGIEAGGHGQADFDADDGAGDFQGEKDHAAGETEHAGRCRFPWPSGRPIPTNRWARAGAGRVALTRRAMSAPRARRNWTGKFWAEKTGKTASMALTRKKTMSQLVSSGIMRGYRTICGIFSIMAVANSIKRPQHPGHEEDQQADDAQGLGDKGQGLFLNGGDGLKQADGQADDHGGDENGRGEATAWSMRALSSSAANWGFIIRWQSSGRWS